VEVDAHPHFNSWSS